MSRITPFLWFDNQAEEAMNFYVSIFKNSKTLGGAKNDGKVLTTSFELDGAKFVALNGGPIFKFTEAISFVVECKDQDEVDYYWDRLSEGGDKSQCAWLKDKFGVSWQIVPTILPELLMDPDPEKSGRVMNAMMQMTKIEIQKLQDAYDGK